MFCKRHDIPPARVWVLIDYMTIILFIAKEETAYFERDVCMSLKDCVSTENKSLDVVEGEKEKKSRI